MENENDNSKKNNLPVSYHTFIYPFTYKENKENKKNLETYIESLNSSWVRVHSSLSGKKNDVETILDFNEYQYFLPKARAIIFDDSEIAKQPTLTYKYNIGNNNAYYSIVRELKKEEAGNDSEKKQHEQSSNYCIYRLKISSLTLQLFPEFKIGMFTFGLEYNGEIKYCNCSDTSEISNALNEPDLKSHCNGSEEEKIVEQSINNINESDLKCHRNSPEEEKIVEQSINNINEPDLKCHRNGLEEEKIVEQSINNINQPDLKSRRNGPEEENNVEQSINIINQLGRRVIVPCLAVKDSGQNNGKENSDAQTVTALLNAYKIIISGLHSNSESNTKGETNSENNTNEKPIEIDFNNRYNSSEPIEFNQPVELILKILFPQSESSKDYEIKSVLDDRMFTACLYRKNEYSPLKPEKPAKDSGYYYLNPYKHKEEAEALYKFVFLEDELSCQNVDMLKEKLNKHVLGRWIDYGTVHAVTEYSLVCVTGEEVFLRETVINPFLTTYVDIVKLALAQRAIITNLEEKTQKVSSDLTSEKDCASDQFLKDVEKLWQEYILFENQMYLPEVTFQEQGVELYDLIKQSLRLKELNDYLKDEIMNLHNIAMIRSERNRVEHEKSEQKNNDMISKNLSMLTIVGVSLAVITFIVNYIAAGQMFLPPGQNGAVSEYVIGSVFQIAGICCMMFLFYKYYKKKFLQYSEDGNSEGIVKGDNGNTNPTNDYIDVIWLKPIIILIGSVIIVIIFKPVVVSIIKSLIEYFLTFFNSK